MTTLGTLATEQGHIGHELCSLTACLDPLHKGPCKGWKQKLGQAVAAPVRAPRAPKAPAAPRAPRTPKAPAVKAPAAPAAHTPDQKTALAVVAGHRLSTATKFDVDRVKKLGVQGYLALAPADRAKVHDWVRKISQVGAPKTRPAAASLLKSLDKINASQHFAADTLGAYAPIAEEMRNVQR
jgi:pyruvate/2-oxoglutarate dehydrogenase complex dihydrolipoamide acyltransferase (E2) component